jgi:hypothetical protein
MANITLTDNSQQSVPGTVTESNNTFSFVPNTIPLADGTYQMTITAVDTYGNAQDHTFSFTIDTQPPAKPAITGGTVASGTLQPRPAQNSANRVMVTVTGTRADHTSVWINGVQKEPLGSGDWSIQIDLIPGNNSVEVFCQDQAGNHSVSEWVDIDFTGQGGIIYEYNAAGRIIRIDKSP